MTRFAGHADGRANAALLASDRGELSLLKVQTNLFNRGDQTKVARAGQASKYSPRLRDAAVKVEGEHTLAEPVR